jgi:competence protein ComEA
VVVDVAGKVRHPGIVRLPVGSRVDDAVRAAGGPLPGASYDGLNRARKLADGEQVLVGVPASTGGAAGGAGQDGRVDLNLADATALDGLPGIGPVLAQKIVDWRTEHGRFASIDQLREVGGIGESKFAALKNKVRV